MEVRSRPSEDSLLWELKWELVEGEGPLRYFKQCKKPRQSLGLNHFQGVNRGAWAVLAE
jgi:hypothetical protein